MPVVYPDFSKKYVLETIDWEKTKALIKSLCNPYWYEQSEGFERAKNYAAKFSKKILLVFTAPQWCGCCQSLEATVFSQCDFGHWAIANGLFLVKFDDANNTAADLAILNQYNITYYPTVFALAPDGQTLGQIQDHHCGGDVATWTNEFENIANIKKARARFKFDPNVKRSPAKFKINK